MKKTRQQSNKLEPKRTTQLDSEGGSNQQCLPVLELVMPLMTPYTASSLHHRTCRKRACYGWKYNWDSCTTGCCRESTFGPSAPNAGALTTRPTIPIANKGYDLGSMDKVILIISFIVPLIRLRVLTEESDTTASSHQYSVSNLAKSWSNMNVQRFH